MSVHSNGETIDSVLARVRAEQALATDASRQALLRHECGVLEEARGDETAAAREFLAAFNADPALREPLEALLRIYGRSRSERHLPKLLQSLVGAARSPAESARALWELGSYREDVEHDWAAAKLCLLEAVELDPSEVACWLGLGLGAAAQGEADLQARALQARAALADEPTWRGLLLVELGEKCAAGGEHARAMELFEQAAALGGSARLGARASQEIAAERAGELDLVLRALEGQAELIELGLEDPAAAVRLGVPRHMHSAVHAAAAWLRVALVRQRLGDPGGSSIALGAAADRLPDNLLLARLRIAACDAAGDGAQAAAIAKGQLAAGAQGGDAAALWVRVGQAAQAAGDENAALEAYGKAAQLDPQSVVARVLETDLLARGDDPARFAAALQAELEVPLPAAGRGRAWLAVACVWALRAQDGARAREALGRAVESGVPELRAQRVARLCAAQCRDEAWHEQATARLCELSASASERAGLWLDLGLSRLRRGQAEAAQAAFGELADVAAQGELPGGLSPWLGHALAAYAVGLGWGGLAQRGSEHVSRLAKVQPGEALARGMALVAALLAARAGEREQALRRLEEEHRRDPADPVAALFLADSQRRGGDAPAAAETLLSCSRASHDPELCGTMQIEAAFLLWRAGDRDAAIAALELAIEHTPVAARVALLWALRAGRPNDQASRRRVLELDEMAGPCAGPLERFGLAAAARDGEAEARGALAELEHAQAGGDVAVAAALGQLLFAGDVDEGSLERALDRLERLGGTGTIVSSAERFRRARFVHRDPQATLHAARRWAEAEPALHPALEWMAAALAAGDRAAEVEARRRAAAQLEGEARAEMEASAAAVRLTARPGEPQPLLGPEGDACRLMNLEISPPGSDPVRRAGALRGLGTLLGAEARGSALALAAWSDLCRGAHAEAKAAFRALVEADPQDLASWEGLRDASRKLDDWRNCGVCCARLGSLCRDDERGAAFWEEAGLVLLEHTDAHEDAEIALERALKRSPRRAVAFDKLFRRVRERKDHDRLLHLIEQRLQVSESDAELTKMYWERARALRSKGEAAAALRALGDVMLLEPDHVGALALEGEIRIARGELDLAAPPLARLASLDSAPVQQRLVSGLAAADLYDKKLGQPEKAVAVLVRLHEAGLCTQQVRERLARSAAAVGSWAEAARILEELMVERETSEGRIEAANLALVIYRDKLALPARAEAAVRQLLEEQPDHAEALALALGTPLSAELRAKAIPAAREVVLQRLAQEPFDPVRVEVLGQIADARGELALRAAALGVLVALGDEREALQAELGELLARAEHVPQAVLDASGIAEIAHPEDSGPVSELMVRLADAVGEALGPSLKTEGVGKRDRIEAHDDPLRRAVASWMGALGFESDFDLYVTQRDALRVRGIAAERPTLVVGSAIAAPFDAATRAAVAREIFALRCGTTLVLHHDSHTVASVAIAASNAADVSLPEPKFAVYREIARAMDKALSRKLRRAISEICQKAKEAGQDPVRWAVAAQHSIDRMAAIAAGAPAAVLDQIAGPPGSPGRKAARSNDRARHLLAFVLSPAYVALRDRFGMGVG